MKRILFLSSVNLTTNPRILKEIKLAISLGYKVSFVGFYLNNWSDELETKHVNELKKDANLFYLNAGRKPFSAWLISSIIEFISKKFFFLFPKFIKINALAANKRSFLLLNWLQKNKPEADLIVAHTLATLYPAYQYAQSSCATFAFDVEDYHPGEKIFIDIENEKRRRIYLMNKILPFAKYVSCAAPLIENEIRKQILNNNTNVDIITVNNNFSQHEFKKPDLHTNREGKLQLVWFSQNISFGRGLEFVLPMLSHFSSEISVTLIGNIDDAFKTEVANKYLSFIEIVKPISQISLHEKLAEFDIGLAIEMSDADYNRQIALTNKIIAYYQAGLYILATKTNAQEKFLTENIQHGRVFDFFKGDFENVFREILSKKESVLTNKEKRFVAASKFNWENESKKLARKWSNQ